MTSTGDVAAKMVAALNAAEPDLDVSVGTVARKLIDAVSESIAEAYSDSHLIQYQYDIDSKSGGDLDDFCFVPGTLVVTADGPRPIEEVGPGETVISHTGKHRTVLASSVRCVDEDIVTMRPLGQPSVSMTGNHPLLATKREWLIPAKGVRSFALRGTGSRARWSTEHVRREWIAAGELRKGDVVWGAAPEPAKRSQLNKNLQRLYGWFLAEGSTTECGRIVFSLAEHETEYHETIEELIKSEWGFARVSHSKPNSGERQLTVFSKKFAAKLRSLLGHGCADKHIPWEVFWSGSDLTDLLAAVWQGDGHVSTTDTVADFVTTSPALVYQIRALLLRKKIFTRMDVKEGGAGKRTAYRLTARGEYARRIAEITRETTPELARGAYAPAGVILDGMLGHAIAEHRLVAYQGTVHNLEVDVDNSYTLLGGMAAHNCALFGITRIPSSRSQGVVTFTRPNDQFAATTALVIPPGTQVVAQTNPIIYVMTTVSAVMSPGQLTADVPVQAVVAGTSGNVAAGMLVTVATAVSGIAKVVNAGPLSGGSNQESDADLRTRFRNTVFRSLAGTQSMYQAIALATPQDPTMPNTRAVTQVNVLGSSKRYREQIQVVAGTAASTVLRAAYIFPDNVYCGADIDAGNLLTQGTNFTFTPSNPTNGTSATAALTALTGMPDGIYDLDFEYVPRASRNDPANTRFAKGGINNRVDVWINGTIADVATQSVSFSNSRLFTSGFNDPYYNQAFSQASAATPVPPVGNIFIPLAYGPVLAVPDTLVINGVTYTEGSDYWITQREDAFGMSPGSLFGLSWQTTRVPPNNAVFAITYNYNRIARDVQDNIALWRLVGTDAQTHCGLRRMVKFHFAIVYDRAYEASSVNTNIDIALSALCSSLGFGASLQVSDVLQTVHNVPGVDNVRFLTSTDDGTNYAMAQMSPWTANSQLSLYASGGRAIDATFGNSEYPVFHSSRIIAKAPNTFMIGA